MTVTTAAVHIPDVWATQVLSSEEFEIEIAPRVDRQYDFVGYGDTYRIQRVPNIEVETKSASTALNAKTYTDTEQTISINVHQGVGLKCESIVKVLEKNNIAEKMQAKMGYGLARATDVNLATLPQSFSQEVGTLGTELTFDQLLAAVQYIRQSGFKMKDCFWLLHPNQKIAFHKMDTFTNALYRGEDNAKKASEDGKIDMFMDAPLVESNLVRSPATGQHENALIHKNAIALIVAQDFRIWTESIALDLSDVVAAEKIYGYSEIDKYSETPGNITATDEWAVLLKGI